MRKTHRRVHLTTTTSENVYRCDLLLDRESPDDVLGIAGDCHIGQIFTDAINFELNQFGLKLNIAKCAVMKFGPAGDLPIQVNGESIREVKEFNYLGSVF